MPDVKIDDPAVAVKRAREIYEQRKAAATNPEKDPVTRYVPNDTDLRVIALESANNVHEPIETVVSRAAAYYAFLKGRS